MKSFANKIIFATTRANKILFSTVQFYAYKRMMSSEVHPVVIAAAISFGFVFMHPFDDGNGRIHRFLIHNILAKSRFTPRGLIFPISTTMLRKIKEYDETLELFSGPLLPLLDFELDSDGRMEVKNETAVYWKYIDMTAIAGKVKGSALENRI